MCKFENVVKPKLCMLLSQRLCFTNNTYCLKYVLSQFVKHSLWFRDMNQNRLVQMAVGCHSGWESTVTESSALDYRRLKKTSKEETRVWACLGLFPRVWDSRLCEMAAGEQRKVISPFYAKWSCDTQESIPSTHHSRMSFICRNCYCVWMKTRLYL